MDVSKLELDELDYELRVRGYSSLPDVEVMRNLLRGLLKNGENHLENFVVQNASDEVAICERKLIQAKEMISSINGDKLSDSYRRVDTKLNHLLGRIDRITTNDEKLSKSRLLLLKTILYLMETADKQTPMRIQQNSSEGYQVTPVTRQLTVSKTKMLASPAMELNYPRREVVEVGTEIFNHTGVALKKKYPDKSVDLVSGTLFVIQYSNGKYIEWKATEMLFETDNTESEWESVDAVRRRTYSTSSTMDSNLLPPVKIAMRDLKSYKVKAAKRQISLRLKDKSRYSFLFQFASSDAFVTVLRSVLETRRVGHHSKQVFNVIGEREESNKLNKSFDTLNLFPDMKPNGHESIWNIMRKIQDNPYAATMQTFSKLTDTLLYRTPEQRPVDQEVAELLTRSLHTDDNERIDGNEYTIVSRNIHLNPRPKIARNQPLNLKQWNSFLDSEGRVVHSQAAKNIIFKGGIEPSLRHTVWKYLLNYYPWDATTENIDELHKAKMNEYFTMKRQWQVMTSRQEEHFSSYRERKNLIGKDVERTDRNLPFYAGDNNPNLTLLHDILMTYVMYNFDVGYVQGMSDLLAPILYLMGNEVDAFWCFAGFMDRVFNNFEFDQSRMKSQLSQLFSLLKVVNKDLADYLEKHESANMFFCFRWLLIHFKREFTFSDVMTLWEVLWTDLPCKNFHLVLCIAILDMEKRNLTMEGMGFTEILKYVNELSCRIDLNQLLCEGEAIVEQLKASGENVPLIIRRIIGLAPDGDESDMSDDDGTTKTNGGFRNDTNATSVISITNISSSSSSASKKNSDENDDSIIEDIEREYTRPEIGFEAFDQAISSNYL